MMPNIRYLAFKFLFLLVFFAFPASAWTELAPRELIWPEDRAQIELTKDVVSTVQKKHFRKRVLDDAFSRELLDNYLKNLDGNRLLFTQQDVDQFRKLYGNQFDDDLKSGKLTAARAIYQRYYSLQLDRLDWLVAQVDKLTANDQFQGIDVVEIDRKDSPWPKNQQEADALWLAQLKNSVIALRLADKPVDNISATLKKRYQAQKDRWLKLTPWDHFEAFINSFTMMYDPHTTYMSPKTSEDFNISMALSLEGIGAILEKDGENTKITRLVTAGPAEKQGELKAGDLIMAIAQGRTSEDWTDVVGWRLDEVVQLIRGKANTYVRLQVKRGESEIRTIAIKREKVNVEDQAASYKVVEVAGSSPGNQLKIGIITIPTFYLDFEALRRRDPNTKSTTRDVAKILDALMRERVSGIVIDLRDNGGGSLIEATQLTDLFIDKGPVVQILNSDNYVDRRHRAMDSVNYDGPLLVLVNHLSASASEIFAGAIQDYQRGLVVGEQTYGKGTVQTLIPLYKGDLKITESKFYRVSGDSTQHRGVVPDISFPSLLPFDEIGESALDYALPWDQIDAAPHYVHTDIGKHVPVLTAKHQARMAKSTEYALLKEQRAWFDQQRARKTLPLNLQAREKLKQQDNQRVLAMNNKVRIAKGLPPFKTITELEDDVRAKRDAKNPYDDFLLMESVHILSDFMRLEGL